MLFAFHHCKSLFLAGAALGLIGAAGQGAQAQTFTFVGDMSDCKVVTLTQDGGLTNFQGYAGRYKGQLGGGPTTNIFCVDIGHEIHNGETYAANTQYNITSAPGSLSGGYYQGGLASALTNGDIAATTFTQATARAGETAYLADQFLNAASFSGASGSAGLLDNFTALNLSIWDIVQDGGDGLTAGTVQTGAQDANAYGGLVSYYEALAGSHADYKSSTAGWIQAPQQTFGQHAQVYVYEKPGGPQAVPEPGPAAFLSSLALALGGFALRRKWRNQAARRL